MRYKILFPLAFLLLLSGSVAAKQVSNRYASEQFLGTWRYAIGHTFELTFGEDGNFREDCKWNTHSGANTYSSSTGHWRIEKSYLIISGLKGGIHWLRNNKYRIASVGNEYIDLYFGEEIIRYVRIAEDDSILVTKKQQRIGARLKMLRELYNKKLAALEKMDINTDPQQKKVAKLRQAEQTTSSQPTYNQLSLQIKTIIEEIKKSEAAICKTDKAQRAEQGSGDEANDSTKF